MFGPYHAEAGIGMKWASKADDCLVDVPMLVNNRRDDSGGLYDIIIISKTLIKKKKDEAHGPTTVIFQASMCTFPRSSLQEKRPGAIIRMKCVVQKIQTKSGVYRIEEVYGLETGIVVPGENVPVKSDSAPPAKDSKKNDPTSVAGTSKGWTNVAKAPNHSQVPTDEETDHDTDTHAIEEGGGGPEEEERGKQNEASNLDSGGECVICLTDPRAVAMFPCRHFCLCMSCAEALPAQGNKCPICRNGTYLLLK